MRMSFFDEMKYKGVDVFKVAGPFLMGTLIYYEEVMRVVGQKPKIRVVNLEEVPLFDPSDLHLLESFYKRCCSDKIHLLLLGVQPQPFDMIKKKGLYDSIGPKNFVTNREEAEKRILEILPK